MATVNLTTGNDTYNIYIGLKGILAPGAKSSATSQIGNTIDGGTGSDTLYIDDTYGSGNYFLTADSSGVVTITTASGTVSFTNFEKVTFSNNATGFSLGTSGNDSLTGGSGADLWLSGGAGDDTINGGAGADFMQGGTGNDTYYVDNTGDKVSELASSGTDTIISTVTYSLVDTDGATVQKAGSTTYNSATNGGNVENLTLSGVTAINGTGNDLDNILTGNSAINTLTAMGGNDTIDGGAGADSMVGGLGNDTFVVDDAGDSVTENAGEGTDTVSASITYTLGSNVENLTLTGTAAINGTGNTLANVITGNAGDNVLDGGVDALVDSLDGGAGNDTYVLADGNDSVTDASGTDTITSTITRSLAGYATVENLTLLGTANIDGTGNALANVITGNSGDNILDGGADAAVDTLSGGTGNDTYVLGSGSDTVTDAGGVDTVTSTITRTLSPYITVENLTLLGAANIDGTGNGIANTITGNSGNNILDGGPDTVVDTLDGGAGNDTFVLGSGSDNVVDASGTDTITSTIARSLASYGSIENLTLLGTANIDGTGNALANAITGNSGDNVLDGGVDALVDSLDGGAGNDTYVLADGSDSVTDVSGTDTITSTITRSLVGYAAIENLTLLGTANIDGTGNALANVITGNSGNNVLDGGADALVDALDGGAGNDTYVLGSGGDTVTDASGTDTITSTITRSLAGYGSIENLTLLGTANIDGTGNALANVITGNSGNNVLDGGADALVDTLDGGAGNDTYVLGSGSDTVTDASGTDTITSTITRSLVGYGSIENLTLLGTSNIDATGNGVANVLTGNSGNNILDGGVGADSMAGGAGDDTYLVDDAGDAITEVSGQGTDTAKVSLATYTLAANVENLEYTGSGAFSGTGNTLANTIKGGAGADVLSGDIGNDSITGGAGNDTIDGGADQDTLILSGVSTDYTFTSIDATHVQVTDNRAGGDGVDTITNIELVQFSGGTTFTVTELLASGAIKGTPGDDVLNGTTGADTIIGYAGNDQIDGDLGADTMIGGAGDDTYVVDDAGDVVTELAGEGSDEVQTSIAYTLGSDVENLTLTGTAATGTGNSLDNTIVGNAANNTLDGGVGADALVGGSGDDVYIVDNAGDTVSELPGEGTDEVKSSVSYDLGADVENLTFAGASNIDGMGNDLANVIKGNSGNNVLDGGLDTLVDSLDGGAGNDTYVLADGNDSVTDASGTDTITSTITRSLAGYAAIENLTLAGAGNIDGTGNALANAISGNSGNNVLDGGVDTLVDTLDGGAGNDTYALADGNDSVTDASGNDTITSTITRSLASYATIENLTLLGAGNIDGTGNALANAITGNSGNNTLDGGADALVDSLDGGAGNDTYVLANGNDSVTDASGNDTITSTITRSLIGYGAIENLTLVGAGNIDGTGNALANAITGNTGNNILDGGADALVDSLDGGAGNDTYVLADGVDSVTDASGNDTITSTITRSLVGYGAIENLTLMGAANIDATGNALANAIVGNSGNNILDGGADALVDSLDGGAGDDTYVLADGNDSVTDASGNDTITTIISRSLAGYGTIESLTLLGTGNIDGTGNALANAIVGNSGNNVLDGGADALVDSLDGGAGNDTYVLADGNDSVTDAGGNDTITSTITRSLAGYVDIENLTLVGTGAINGTGSALANAIVGNDGNNVLNGGTDTLVDTLNGGLGNDTYVLADGSDSVTDSGGTDTITSTITRSLAGYASIENLILVGAGAVNATGNALANVISGNGAANILNGGADALVDTLKGGLGNDTYVLAAGNDAVIDTGGVDTITSTITRSLAGYAVIENLTLLGSAAINGTGNALGNTITGNGAKNIITGGAGRDIMTGGGGADVFDFNLATESGKLATTRDVIKDFAQFSDKIDLNTIDTNTALAGNQNFTFLATKGAAFTGVVGQLHYLASGTNTIIEGDTNGDKIADFQIELTGTKTLTAVDFVL